MSQTSNPNQSDDSIEPEAKPESEYDEPATIRYRGCTDFQKRTLRVIAEYGDPYGLKVKEGLQDYYQEEINHGRLYPNLDTLVELGFVVKSQRDRRSNHYEITETGRDVLTAEIERDYNEVCDA